MDDKVLEQVYQENLAERIISRLAETENMSFESAMNVFYTSKLARMIQQGQFDVQYLDYRVLTQMLCEEMAYCE